jgi:hypothetical protein
MRNKNKKITRQDLLLLADGRPDFVTDFTLGALEIIPGVAAVVHQGKKVVLHADELVVLPLHVGHVHVVCRRANILVLLAYKKKNNVFTLLDSQNKKIPIALSLINCRHRAKFQ